jgi:hypothetical protein
MNIFVSLTPDSTRSLGIEKSFYWKLPQIASIPFYRLIRTACEANSSNTHDDQRIDL